MNNKSYVVVVGMDYSALADRALNEALELCARREDSETHVLYVVSPPTVDSSFALGGFAGEGVSVDSLGGALERLQRHVQERLDAFGKQSAAPFRGRVLSHVRIDDASPAIVQLASELQADLIVIGTHGRRGVPRLLMGSVAETTLRHARCPVLVVPPKTEPATVMIEPPCPECVKTRADSEGKELWCAQHRERHGRRHTYHQADRAAGETNFPLVVQ